MTFVATEGTTQPIVLGKEPVEKPPITRGSMAFGIGFPHVDHRDGTVSFAIPVGSGPDDFVVTYHRVNMVDGKHAPEMIDVMVMPSDVVTWEIAGH